MIEGSMTFGPRLFVVGSRGKWTSAGGIAVDRRGRIALVRQRGCLAWSLPKGRIEPGETLEMAAVREVHEETGARTRVTGYVGVYEGKRNFVHYFLMTVRRLERRSDADEIDAVRFVTPARALDLLSSRRDRKALAAALPARSRARVPDHA
jgi:8-oxo-dGTP diphosphatase